MARRHNLKRHRISVPITRTLVTPEKSERRVVLNPATNEYEPQVVVQPAVYLQGKAMGRTVEDKPKVKK